MTVPAERARRGVLRAGRARGRHRRRGAQQGARPGGRPAHVPRAPTTASRRWPSSSPSTSRRTCCRSATRRSWSPSNREACAKYKRALDKLLPPEWSEAVYTENAADVVDRPLVAELQLSDEREEEVRLLFKKADREPEDPDRHRQAAHRLRRAGAVRDVPRQADARPRAAAGDRARQPALRRRRRRAEARRPRRRLRRRPARAEEGAAVRLRGRRAA